MKRFLTATTFMCLFSISALAGDIPISGSPAPPTSGETEITSPGDIPISGTAEPITDAALSALLTAIGFLTV